MWTVLLVQEGKKLDRKSHRSRALQFQYTDYIFDKILMKPSQQKGMYNYIIACFRQLCDDYNPPLARSHDKQMFSLYCRRYSAIVWLPLLTCVLLIYYVTYGLSRWNQCCCNDVVACVIVIETILPCWRAKASIYGSSCEVYTLLLRRLHCCV